MSNQCKCWIVHVTDPARRAAIERQIEIEKKHRPVNHGAIVILREQLLPCPGSFGVPEGYTKHVHLSDSKFQSGQVDAGPKGWTEVES